MMFETSKRPVTSLSLFFFFFKYELIELFFVLYIPQGLHLSMYVENYNCHFVSLYVAQSGFKTGSSTELLMLHLRELWRWAVVDKNRTGGVLFIDFNKVFDSICHEAMALKFQLVVYHGTFTTWLLIIYLGGNSMWRLQ